MDVTEACSDPRRLDTGLNAVSYVQEGDDRDANAEACREYDLTAQMVNDWKAQFLAAAPQAFEKGVPSSGEAERIAELEQMVGKLTMQLEIAKKASRLLDGTSRRNGKRS
jgi:hypothetical protein